MLRRGDFQLGRVSHEGDAGFLIPFQVRDPCPQLKTQHQDITREEVLASFASGRLEFLQAVPRCAGCLDSSIASGSETTNEPRDGLRPPETVPVQRVGLPGNQPSRFRPAVSFTRQPAQASFRRMVKTLIRGYSMAMMR